MFSYTIIGTVEDSDPERAARAFGTMLALEKGYTSRIVFSSDGSWICVASDNRAIRFVKGA